MDGMKYETLGELLERVDEPHRSACKKILAACGDEMRAARGSTRNHQAWPGGYLDHVREIMNVAVVLYGAMGARRPLTFTLSDALFVLFLHDLEKPWAFVEAFGFWERRAAFVLKEDAQQFRMAKLAEHGVQLSDELERAVSFVEGEIARYSAERRAMSPLAAFCHMCDVASARVWFDHPLEQGDPWPGAGRLGGA